MKFHVTDLMISSLQSSIEKWENIVDETGTDGGTDDCQCCIEFYGSFSPQSCCGCPIAYKTNSSLCENTPYEKWAIGTTGDNVTVRMVTDKKTKKLAINQLNFLKNLLHEMTSTGYIASRNKE
jgi:hypothetical protein